MELFFQFTLLLIGLALLWRMGELCVRNALGFSAIFGIHQFTIGFFIFAISTGLPEISSAVVSSLNKVPELSVGDLLGSTFVNMSLILGIIAILANKITISPALRKNLFIVVIMIAVLITWFILVKITNLINGILLITVYLISIYWFRGGLPKEDTTKEIKEIKQEVKKEEKKAIISPKINILAKLFGSLGLLLLSSWITVHAAVKLSKLMHINLTLVGGTLIAVGTSFPELVLEIHAVKRKEYSLALGDLFGSSLLNISFVLGMLLVFNPKVNLSFVWKLLPFISAVLVWVFQGLVRKKELTRRDGLIFFAIFLCYIGSIAYSHFIL